MDMEQMTTFSEYDDVYWVRPDGRDGDGRYLRARWLEEPFRTHSDDLLSAIAAGEAEPDLSRFNTISVETKEGRIELTDLRGINFSRVHVGASNLSYCCFDHSLFIGAVLEKTHLQYSTLEHAHCEGSLWKDVQASPIYAREVKFNNAEFSDAYLMHSSLALADFTEASLHGVSFSSADLTEARLSDTLIVEDCDAWAAHFADTVENRGWLERNNVKGQFVFHLPRIGDVSSRGYDYMIISQRLDSNKITSTVFDQLVAGGPAHASFHPAFVPDPTPFDWIDRYVAIAASQSGWRPLLTRRAATWYDNDEEAASKIRKAIDALNREPAEPPTATATDSSAIHERPLRRNRSRKIDKSPKPSRR